MSRYLWLAFAAAIVVPASSFAQDSSDGERIRNARAQYNDAIARHDIAAIIAFLDEDYQITTSLGQMARGRDAEAGAWQALFASREDVLYVRSPESVETSSAYPLAAETGTWVGTWTTDSGTVRTGGRYAAMWRRVAGTWKVRSELFVALYCEGERCP